MNILMVILLGFSLSMDTFSLAMSLGTLNISSKKAIIYSFLVGAFHFFMPLLGHILFISIRSIFNINSNRLLFFVFAFIGFEMLIDLFTKEENKYNFNNLEMIICAFSVSIDSLTIGVGLNEPLTYLLINSLIFFLFSTFFTFLGYKLGHTCKSKLGKIANIIGIVIIFVLMILQL